MTSEVGRARRAKGSLGLVAVLCCLTLGSAEFANAGVMHARAVIGLGIDSQTVPHGGIAHASRTQGSKYRVAHEEFGNNYTYGNAGSGHAHHHSGRMARQSDQAAPEVGKASSAKPEAADVRPPVVGSSGSSHYVRQTWLPGTAGKTTQVVWTPENFLQVDPADIASRGRITSRASISSKSLQGTVELAVEKDASGKPKINTRLTGAFAKRKFELVTHPNGVVSMKFAQPLEWTIAQGTDNLDISLDASIDVK